MTTKQQHRSRPKPKSVQPGRKVVRARKGNRKNPGLSAPLAASPNQVHIDLVERNLNPEDQVAFKRIVSLLKDHLGSAEAARSWLFATAPEFGKPPLAIVAAGKPKLVLALLESRWGASPAYG